MSGGDRRVSLRLLEVPCRGQLDHPEIDHVGLDAASREVGGGVRSGPTRNPDRWTLSLTAFGPLGTDLGWRAIYTQASNLAFRRLSRRGVLR